VIVKKLKRAKEALTVQTELGAAVVEGTEFVFEVDPDRSVTIAVLEGAIRVYPRAAAWTDTTRYVAGERVTFDSLQITKLAPLASPAIAALRQRIQVIEGASPAVKPFWQSPLFIVPVVAAGVVAGVLLLDDPEPPADVIRDGTVTVDLPF
jgi:ferric-dicitrate binding protein FerR (iron transport regulator)